MKYIIKKKKIKVLAFCYGCGGKCNHDCGEQGSGGL